MRAFEARWVRIILASFAPAEGSGAPPHEPGLAHPLLAPREGEVDYVATFEGMRASAGPLARFAMRLALWLVALSPLWHAHAGQARARSLASLPLPARQALLAALLDHPAYAVREAALMLKLGASLALFASDALRARSGYDGPLAPLVPAAQLRRSGS